jgi:hypothetical protein
MDELEQLARELLAKAEELGLDSLSITWHIGNKSQERSYYCSDEDADAAFLKDVLEKAKGDGPEKEG